MHWFRVISSVSTALSLVFGATSLHAESNTNQCIRDLGGIQSCQDQNSLGFPNDIQACCDGVRQLSEDSCHCNPAIDGILGTEGQKIYQLEALCRIAQPKKWDHLTPFFLRKCEAVQGKSYGCEKPDIEIDGDRLKTIFAYQEPFAKATDESLCLDTPAFTKHLASLSKPDIKFTVPYGIGTYEGTQSVAEYLGMGFNGLTHGLWMNDTSPDPSKPTRFEVSGDGKIWTLGFTTKGAFLRGLLPYTDAYLEQDVEFQGCEALISHYTVKPTEGMKFLAEQFVQAADLSQRWGVEDICRYHTQYCANDPATRQYESEEECKAYISSLPLYSPKCGPNRPLSGSSLSCKFKHHFMIPANPQMHCAHIGKAGTVDIDSHLKCDDTAECSQDIGQDSWPNMTQFGDATPAENIKIYQHSNVGYESEPMGCAVPSETTSEHDHIH